MPLTNQAETDTRSAITAMYDLASAYVAAAHAGDVEAMAAIFHDDARMVGYLGDDLMTVPIDAFYDLLRSVTAPISSGEPYRAEVVDITVHGTIGLVELHERSYLGRDFVDLFTTQQVDDRWLFVHKSFTQVTR